jgi:hypothetical protein
MNEKKFVAVRTSSSHTISNYKLYVSDIIGNNGFSSHIENAMKFEVAQAKTIKKALESVEQIHSDMFYNEGIKVSYSIKEVQI